MPSPIQTKRPKRTLPRFAICSSRSLPKKTGPVGLPAPAGRGQEAPPQVAPEQARVAGVEHLVGGEEAERPDHGGADSRLAPPWPSAARRRRTPSRERLVAGDKRALARAISLVENRDPAGDELVAELFPRTGSARIVGLTGPARGRQEHPDRRDLRRAAQGRPRDRRALDRPLEPVHPGRRARRPDPPLRALPRPRRLHPLDGDAGLARRARRGGAAGGAADGRLRQGRRPARDGRRRPGRDRRRRSRRHDRPRADARLGRLDPGAEGRRDGDPRRDRASTRPTTRSPTR